MSSNFKPAPASHTEPVRGGNFYRLAIVGAGSLKGKEVAEVLNDRNFPSIDVKLLDDEEALGKLEAVGDEVTFIQNVRTEQFQNIDFTFFASDPESTRKNWKTARNAGSAIIDLSSALEDEPDAAVRSPWIERQLGQPLIPELQPGPAVVAHPAAVVLALLLLRVQKAAPVKRAVATVFEPASEHGQKGMDELHEQTVNLLSFQQLPKNIFDTQVAFNMVARYGEHSVPSLATVESRVLKHYQANCWQGRSAAIAVVGAGSHLSRTRLCDSHRTRAGGGYRKHFASAGRRACEPHAWSRRRSHQRECRGTESIFRCRSPRMQVSRMDFGCGPRPIICASPRQLRWSVRKPWQQPAPEAKSNEMSRGVALAVLLSVFGAGCGYHTAGHAVTIPDNVRTIAIPAFVNQTQTFKIEQMLTAAVVREFVTRTHYHVINQVE